MRGVEEVKGLQDSKADQHIHNENPDDVHASDFKNAGTELADTEKKGNGENQNRESAGVDAVNQSRYAHQRQKPLPLIRDIPECLGTEIAGSE